MFFTKNPDEFSTIIAGVAPGASARAIGSRDFHATGDFRALQNTAIFSVSSVGLGVETDAPRNYIGVTLPLEGSFCADCSGTRETFLSREAHILDPQRPFDFRAKATNQVLVVNFFKRPMDEFLTRLNGRSETDDLGFTAAPHRLHLSKGQGLSFLRLANFAWSEVSRGDAGAFATESVASDLEATLVSLFLAAVDEQSAGGVMRDDILLRSGPARRKAEDFIEANLAEPITLADISAAAGTPVRTLGRVFREHHALSVMAFVRHRRLQAARLRFLVAEPSPGAVTRIAFECGFGHLGRFAETYRAAYGELPSETLGRV